MVTKALYTFAQHGYVMDVCCFDRGDSLYIVQYKFYVDKL